MKFDRKSGNHIIAGWFHWFDEIALEIILHYALYILLVIFAKPENVRSEGVHQTVGDCNAVSSQYSTIGQVSKQNLILIFTVCVVSQNLLYFCKGVNHFEALSILGSVQEDVPVCTKL